MASTAFTTDASAQSHHSPIKSTQTNDTNRLRLAALSENLKEILDEVLIRQFYGNVNLQFSIQEGIIQSIHSSVEKLIR